jgi:hypothetical protein
MEKLWRRRKRMKRRNKGSQGQVKNLKGGD